MIISNFQIPVSKSGIVSVVLFLTVIPFICQAFSVKDFWSEFGELFLKNASSTQVTNEIKVSVNTGGNTAIEGEVIEGKAKTEIKVKNIINGQEIDPIDIEAEANEVKVKSEIRADEGKAIVQREIEIGSEKQVQNYEVDLGSSGAEAESYEEGEQEGVKQKENELQSWQKNFWFNLKSFFKNIFSSLNLF